MIQCSLSKAEFIRYSKVKSNNVRMVMLRFDEMNDSTLMIHVIDPYAQRSERFGRISMQSIKNISVPFQSTVTAPHFLAAVKDGVVSKDKNNVISEFGTNVAMKLCEGRSNAHTRYESAYSYDIEPLQSEDMEMNSYFEAKEIRKPEDDGYLTAEKKLLGVSHAKPSATINPTFVDVFSRNIENQLTSQAPPSIPNMSLPNQIGGTQSTYNSKFSSKFTIEKILGVGGYGIVFESLSNSDGLRYAVKRISVEENEKMSTFREVSALTELDHPGIVKYKDSWVESPSIRWQMGNDLDIMNRFPTSTMPTFHRCNQTATLVYIQMEMCLYSLADWLKQRDTEYRISSWFKQIVSAVAYIHEKGFMHRDLKPSNILFSNPNTLKICDLGVATQRMIQDGEELTGSYTNIGSPLYMAPEQSGWRYTSKVDVFALGLILAELSVVMTEEERRVAFNSYRSGKPNGILKNQPRNAEYLSIMDQKLQMEMRLWDACIGILMTGFIIFLMIMRYRRQIAQVLPKISTSLSSSSVVVEMNEFSSKFLKEFEVLNIIGEGGFGCVFQVRNKYDQSEYAIKRIPVENDDTIIEKALREVRALAQLKHMNIVGYNDSEILRNVETIRRIPLCTNSLSDWLNANQQQCSRSLPRIRSWFKQIVSAVEYIHSKNLIHRDLKARYNPSNILIVDEDTLKLCDLGIATKRQNGDENATTISRTQDIGTALYMSPEQRTMPFKYSSKSDIFSLGLVFAELCLVMISAERSNASFVSRLVDVDPDNRPTSQQLLSDSFLYQ
ncbi:hypothetical protein PRIPAC_87869 [Pristionchus pacificus]|uniref:Protein kinase domain-containing protein n=1 Tax=Pristionchus pacificus TaxID=54126 RepID=A0A2A6CXL2_PRIPA|nr:hypothetical protein PRIPAC_87869 [Pristionchus pacificus]|eukprot:PDM82826.1 protein kinase [Pristionchus pacificus]